MALQVIVKIAFAISLIGFCIGPSKSHETRRKRSISQNDINRVREILSKLMQWQDMPPKFAEFLTVLNKNLYILSCLPTQKNGDCYQTPGYCSLQPIKVDGRPVKLQLTICKSPVQIIIRYRIPLPSWARLLLDVDLNPIVIRFDTNSRDGVTLVRSASTAKVSVRGIGLGLLKVELKMDGIFRWDCTKPYDLMTRLSYNMGYDDKKPGYDYNKMYYKLRVRLEFKVKKVPCFFYRCRRCENLVDEQGHVSQGPASCNTEISVPLEAIKLGSPSRGLRVYQQKFQKFSPYCHLVPLSRNVNEAVRAAHNVYFYYLIQNPKKINPGTKLIFAGIKKKRELADFMSFFKDKKFKCNVDV